jgi:hypothetical protein
LVTTTRGYEPHAILDIFQLSEPGFSSWSNATVCLMPVRGV